MSKIDRQYFKEFVTSTSNLLNMLGLKCYVHEGDDPASFGIAAGKEGDDTVYIITNSKSQKEMEELLDKMELDFDSEEEIFTSSDSDC